MFELQLVENIEVTCSHPFVKPIRGSYGKNFRRIREAKKLAQEEIARRLGVTRQANLPARERNPNVPRPPTILRHATALGCQPWELLDGLVFPYDELRRPSTEESTGAHIAPIGATFRETKWNSKRDDERRSGTDRRLATAHHK